MKNNIKKIVFCIVGLIAVTFISFVIYTYKTGNYIKEGYSIEYNENLKPIEIENKYCTMFYPSYWEKFINYEEIITDDLYVVKFRYVYNDVAKEIFTVTFGALEAGNPLGYINYNNNRIPVYVSIHEVDFSDINNNEEINIISAMQESVNYLINSIEETEAFVAYDDSVYVNNSANKDINEQIKISTPYCELNYPLIWKDYLRTDDVLGESYTKNFYYSLDSREVKLFSIYFNVAETGEKIGYLNANGDIIPINVEMYNATSEVSLSEDERNIINAMSEAINEVIYSIENNVDFISIEGYNNKQDFNVKTEVNVSSEHTNVDSEFVEINTNYCILQFPSQWSDYLEVEESSNNETYTKTFYCSLNNEQYKLFSVYFNMPDEGNFIGYIIHNNVKTSITIESFDLDLRDSMPVEDKNIIYTMMDCINDVIQSIILNEYYSEE